MLPAGLKVDLMDSIAREYEWVLQAIARVPARERVRVNACSAPSSSTSSA